MLLPKLLHFIPDRMVTLGLNERIVQLAEFGRLFGGTTSESASLSASKYSWVDSDKRPNCVGFAHQQAASET